MNAGPLAFEDVGRWIGRNVRQTPGKDERRSIRYVVAVRAVADVNGDNGPPRFPRQRMLGRRNSQSKNLF